VSEHPAEPAPRQPAPQPPARWSLRWHVPHRLYRDGHRYGLVTRTFTDPEPSASLLLTDAAGIVAAYDHLVPGTTLDILGDPWRVVEVAHHTRILLERAPS